MKTKITVVLSIYYLSAMNFGKPISISCLGLCDINRYIGQSCVCVSSV